jgi:hypothetical protein
MTIYFREKPRQRREPNRAWEVICLEWNLGNANVALLYFQNDHGIDADGGRVAGSGGCDLSVVRQLQRTRYGRCSKLRVCQLQSMLGDSARCWRNVRSKPILCALSSPSVIFPADPPVSLDRIEGLGSNCGHPHWFQENSQKPSCIRIKRMTR